MSTVFTSDAEALRQQMLGGGPGLPPVLANHPTQSAVPIDGWKSIFFGLPFFLAGLFIGYAPWNGDASRKHAPDWLIGLIASFFSLAGAFLVVHGIRGLARRAAHGRDAVAQPGQPWLADHHWHREGSSFSAFNEMLRRLVAAVLWNAFLVPFFWVGLNVRGMGRVFLVFASLFALIGLIFWARWLQMLSDLLRYGNSLLLFDSFPYFLGSQLNARLRVPRNLDAIDELTLTLRCVQEKYVTTGTGNNRRTQVVCYELYKDVTTISRSQFGGTANSPLPVFFHLPNNQPASQLSNTPPIYWEIEARGTARGADYEAYFLLPVYKNA